MACARPKQAWIGDQGRMIFNPYLAKSHAVGPMFEIACGKCMPCRVLKKQHLGLRLVHERKMHQRSCWMTLTYAPEQLPPGGTLVKRDVQLFVKRVRKQFGDGIRYYACGEYGERFKRAHYHVVLFGLDFDDRYLWRRAPAGHDSFRSPTLERLWPLGHSEVMAVTEKSCAYVAGYVTKKISGSVADDYYRVVDDDGVVHQLEPEFAVYSKGLGLSFFLKFYDEIVNNDSCIYNGKEVPLPGYYIRKHKQRDAVGAEGVGFERSLKAEKAAIEQAADLTPERREVRERVLIANMSRFRKPLD